MSSGEMQQNFLVDLYRLRLELSAIFGHVATQNPADVDQGMTAANHADVMRAVADYVAFCT